MKSHSLLVLRLRPLARKFAVPIHRSHGRSVLSFLWPGFFAMLFMAAFASGATFMVSSSADTYDGICNEQCTLREAIAAANMAPSNDEVVFHPTIFSTPKIVNLAFGAGLGLESNGEIIITGPGSNLLTVNGTNLYQVFVVRAGGHCDNQRLDDH